MPIGIYHNHHIVPKHAGGTNNPNNLIRLTIPGHAFAHWCLWMKFGRPQDKMAWYMLSGKTEEGERVRIEMSRLPRHKYTQETRAKMSASRMGHKDSPETRAKKSAANKRNYNKEMVASVGVGPTNSEF